MRRSVSHLIPSIAAVATVFLAVTDHLAAEELNSVSNRTEKTEEYVVTATRTAMLRSEVGASISVIDAATIEQRQYRFALEALESLPGVTINQNGPFGGVATVRLRGARSEQTLVLLDGMIVNDPSAPSGGFDFARLDLEDVDRIEVLRGPQSILYGSDALGGVVNIITMPSTDGLTATGFLEGGSFGTLRGGATLRGGSDRANLRLSASGIRSDGISKADERDGNTEHDPYRNISLSGQGRATLSTAFSLEGFVRYATSRNHFDSFGFATGIQDGDEIGDIDELVGNARARLSLFRGRFESTLASGYAEIDRNNFSHGLPSFSANGKRLTVEYQGDMKVTDDILVVLGARTEETRLKTDTEQSTRRTHSGFGLLQVSLFEGLSLSSGVRHDDHETFGGVTTLRFTGSYNITETGTTFRASWGEGFKAPTPFQLTFFCCGAAAPNTTLQPETSTAWDSGIEQFLLDGALRMQATFFHQETDNLIDFSFLVGGYENIARTRSKGVELELDAHPYEWLTFSGNYTYAKADDLTTGLPLIRVPRNTARFSATVVPSDGLDVTLSGTYNGDEADSRGTVDRWFRLDVAARFDIGNGIELFGRIDNLLNVHYQEVFGFGTPGISAFGGVRFRSSP